jgi:hypothetical protein
MRNHHNHWRAVPLIAAAVATVLTIGAARAEAQVIPPEVPANLHVEPGNAAFLIAHAFGTQNYICLLAPGGFEWTFFAPQATLFDAANQQVITHFLSPNPDEEGKGRATWQHSGDTSAVWAGAIASSTDSDFVAAGSIPWLLLRVVGAEDGPTLGTTLSATTFIQRVNTRGGLAPSDGCKRAADAGRKALVPYSADYVFYTK